MIVAIIPDRFNAKMKADAASLAEKGGRAASMAGVRRPTRGIQLKEDTYATLRVLKADGTEIALVDGGAASNVGGVGSSKTYSNFLIQAVSEDRAEKQQIVETFGEAFIFFFGERPRVISIQGVLLNTFDFNWEAEWWHNYDNYLRGTKCVESRARVYLTYDDTMVSGYILSTSSSKSSQEKNHVGFSFQLFVTDYTNISKVGSVSPDQRGTNPLNDQFKRRGGLSSYGPMLLPYQRNVLSVKKPGLVASMLSKGLREVNKAMAKAQQLSTLAMVPSQYLDRFLGNTVRVPVGFAGAVAFDETQIDLGKFLKNSLWAAGLDGNPIRYTASFSDNSDEYVMATPAYMSVSQSEWWNEQSAFA
jgi:hypothetical protein